MIEHVRENIGKEFFFISPIKTYPYKKIEFYIVCKVKIIHIFNKHSEVLITDVISEDPKFTRFTEYMKDNTSYYCLNKLLYPIYEKEAEK